MRPPRRAPAHVLAALLVAATVLPGCARSGSREVVVVDEPRGERAAEPRPDARPEPSAPSHLELCAKAARVGRAKVQGDASIEVSGLHLSRHHADVLWAVNDSGNRPELIALSKNGEELGVWRVDGAVNTDWEDLAVLRGETPVQDRIVIADLGDAGRNRREFHLWVVTEPDPTVEGSVTAPATKVVLTYDDRGTRDAEAMFIDPLDGTIVVITKAWDGKAASVYTAPASVIDDGRGILELAGDLNLPPLDLVGVELPASLTQQAPGSPIGAGDLMRLVTAADIGHSGSLIAVRTYATVHLYQRQEGESAAEALTRAPCQAPSMPEGQGEAITLLPDERGYVTIGEGANRPINRFELPAPASLDE